MYYELYADSLWLLNFVMNLYLLILVDRSLMRTATRLRLVLGAAAGALLYLVPFVWEAPIWLKYPAGVIAGVLMLVWIPFRPRNIRALIKILEKLALYSFLMGGLFLFLAGNIPFLQERLMSVCGVLGLGAAAFLLTTWLQEGRRKNPCATCEVTLIRNDSRLCVTALIDSGNSLTEPISGKPVSVIDERTFRGLWEETDMPYRAVPYRSIGRKRGILPGYLLPELWIERDGMVKRLQNVYVAVSGEYAGEERMILNPALLEGVRQQGQGQIKR